MLKKLVLILATVAATNAAFAARQPPPPLPTMSSEGVEYMAECECQHYGVCSDTPPPKPPPPTK